MSRNPVSKPSLERLVESGGIPLETLHPGGREITGELARLCRIGEGSSVLDVAAGTGESACFLAESFGCRVTGIDAAPAMVAKARAKGEARHLPVRFLRGDAHRLPFAADSFDAVVSECTLCLLEKETAVREMVRVARPGGYVGMHDLFWQEGTPDGVKTRLAEVEGESPETLAGWRRLFESAGLAEVAVFDRSALLAGWEKDIRKRLGLAGAARLLFRALREWGVAGLPKLWSSARIFQGPHTGYGIVVGRKPPLQ